jgi:hypothetical protein
MRGTKTILSSIVITAIFTGMAMAATAAPAKVEADCQRLGGEVSALIDAKLTSPNISAARSAFQVGIMECMEGENTTANKHYQDAKTLLTGEQPRTPVAPFAPTKAAVALEPDCQRVGGDVSALIDTKATSPNIAAARAAFQVGIMECMEGDYTAANKHYFEAKNLLAGN